MAINNSQGMFVNPIAVLTHLKSEIDGDNITTTEEEEIDVFVNAMVYDIYSNIQVIVPYLKKVAKTNLNALMYKFTFTFDEKAKADYKYVAKTKIDPLKVTNKILSIFRNVKGFENTKCKKNDSIEIGIYELYVVLNI